MVGGRHSLKNVRLKIGDAIFVCVSSGDDSEWNRHVRVRVFDLQECKIQIE